MVVFFILVSVTSLWPKGKFDEHLKDASSLLSKEDVWWMPFRHMPIIPSGVDAVMLNITGTLNSQEPIRSGMRMDLSYTPDSIVNPLHDSRNFYDFKNFVEGEATVKHLYARYWHGYTVVLRPLLSVLTLSDVRRLSFFSLMTLFSAVTILLAHRASNVVAMGFAVSMLMGGFPLLTFSMMYVSNFAIALILMFVLLRWNIRNEESLVRLFLLAGSFTAFLDFLTVPVVTFMLPLLAMLLPDLERQPHWDRHRIRSIFFLGVAWSAGYFLTWAAKWGLADMLLGERILLDGVNRILFYTGSSWFEKIFAIVKNVYTILPLSPVFPIGIKETSGIVSSVVYQIRNTENLTWMEKLVRMIQDVPPLLPPSLLLCLIVTALILVVYLIVVVFLVSNGKKRNSIGLGGYFSLAFLFLIPYFWYFVTANHSSMHYWFTFRNQISSVWLFLILPYIMKKKDLEAGRTYKDENP
jgi:hypothetical protein